MVGKERMCGGWENYYWGFGNVANGEKRIRKVL